MLGKNADWKIHALSFVLTMIAEFIGTQKFDLGFMAFSLFPMLYVLILGMALGVAKVIPEDMRLKKKQQLKSKSCMKKQGM